METLKVKNHKSYKKQEKKRANDLELLSWRREPYLYIVVDTSLAISYLSDSLYFVIDVGCACQGSEHFIGKCNGTLKLIHITHPLHY